MWERHTQGYALAVLGVCGGGRLTWNSRRPLPLRPTLLLKAAGRERGSTPGLPPMGEPGGHDWGRGTNTSLTSATWVGGERSCLPPSCPSANCWLHSPNI